MKAPGILLLTLLSSLLPCPCRAQDQTPFSSFIELPWRYLIGGHAGGQWLDSQSAGRRLTAPETAYRVFTLKGETARVTAGRPAPDADLCPDVWLHPVTPDPDPISPIAIGVNAAWNPMPRLPVVAGTTDPAAVATVRDLLIRRGLAKPQVNIIQQLQLDLDGDGPLETLITARHFANEVELLSAVAGDYGLVLMQRQIKGRTVTQVLHGEAFPKTDKSTAPSLHEISGVLDLDGDGRMEVILHVGHYEGGGSQVWQLRGNKLVKVLEVDCGV